MAGDLINKEKDRSGATIYPVDSEHSAIWQCLSGETMDDVRKIILTGSGGPFRNRNIDSHKNITPDEALNHPNWEMGKKITIDSASMMKKGLEVIEATLAANVDLKRPLAVAFFSNEEGSRYPPDMMGSLAYVGGMSVESVLEVEGADGTIVGEELERIGYRGAAPCPGAVPHAFVELHIEQGPVLDNEAVQIGVVEGVQGISWTELKFIGQSNHAGTTPMSLRRDPMAVAAEVAVAARAIATDLGGAKVATVGSLTLHPNLVNVVPAHATMTVDLRNTDETLLRQAEQQLMDSVQQIADREDINVESRSLARFEPVEFDKRVVDAIEALAQQKGLSTRRMPSGAGHDAQMIARVCPTGMIFVPSLDGISPNPAEHTDDEDLVAGAQLLADAMLALTEVTW